MLVCSISMRALRRAIAADIAEAAAALDASTIGTLVLATLVDDPGAANDAVDAYLGEIMLEAASATDSVDGGFAFSSDIAEAASATDTQSADTAVAHTTWNPSDTGGGVTLSGGNLVATNTSLNTGVRGVKGQSSGKYYFELNMTTWASSTTAAGFGLSTAALNGSWSGSTVVNKSGIIWVNGGSTSVDIGSPVQGDTIGIAVDIPNNLVWCRIAPSGQWNAGGAADPATGTGGVSISAMSGTQYPIAILFSVGDKVTANFGDSAFSGSVPSGFTSGWPA